MYHDPEYFKEAFEGINYDAYLQPKESFKQYLAIKLEEYLLEVERIEQELLHERNYYYGEYNS